MALKQNGTLFAQYPIRRFGGLSCVQRSLFNPSRNMHQTGVMDPKGGIPCGHRAPSSWFLPLKTGFMTAFTGTEFSVSANGTIADGRNLEGSADLVFDASGTGQLVASGTGSASMAITASGTIQAAKSGVGTADLSISASGAISAIGIMAGSAAMAVSASGTIAAIGFMSGTTLVTEELSVDAIVNGVLAGLDGQSGGLTVNQEAMLRELWQKEGLDPARLVTITKQAIKVGNPSAPDITINLTGDLKNITTLDRQ